LNKDEDMLQAALIMPASKSKKEVRALGAMERLFWLMDQKHPAHLTVTAEVPMTPLLELETIQQARILERQLKAEKNPKLAIAMLQGLQPPLFPT
jgi:hypothetical protein